ncbi:MAG: 4Fe-4S binding protein [Methanomassiliicoccales archaeon]|jgi:heterodisulfide reductase subunit A-like polyferredoxin|nr:4Fe-4S binding protein [Methanomassiliicoccales archaeon]
MSENVSFGKGDEMIALVTATRSSRPHRDLHIKDRIEVDDRVAVFLCRCGGAVSEKIDVDLIAREISEKDGRTVAYALDFACSSKGRGEIKRILREFGVGRFVIGGCSPKTHELVFRDLAIEAGINPFMFEIANIREQCAFVHRKEDAAHKAKALIAAAIAKCRLLVPSPYTRLEVASRKVLVIGNGITAIEAATRIVEEGIEVAIANPEDAFSLEKSGMICGGDLIESIEARLQRLRTNPFVKIFMNAEIVDFSGHVGQFRALVSTGTEEMDIECGAVVLAMDSIKKENSDADLREKGVIPLNLFEESERARTDQRRIVILLTQNEDTGSCRSNRDADVFEMATRIRQLNPKTEITIICRDVRTYGMHELVYKKAQEQGIRVIRTETEVRVEKDTGLSVIVDDASSGLTLRIPADVVFGEVPRTAGGTATIARTLRIPLTEGGFFRKTQVKLKPAATIREGIFLCGSAAEYAPALEFLLDAKAAASRAAALVKSRYIEIGGVVAEVTPEKCSACLTCVRSCPYEAPFIGEAGKAEIEIEKCRGCGICVGICPSKAIEMYFYSDPQLTTQVRSAIRGF